MERRTRMGINEQVKMGGGGGSGSLFRRDVKYRFLRGKEPITFRILPAFPHGYVQGQGDSMDWVPFRTDPETLSDWCLYVQVATFVGHGQSYPARKDFVSSLSFPDGEDCLLTRAYHTAKSNPEWRYLVAEEKDQQGKSIKRPALPLVQRMLVCNIVDLAKSPDICTLGVMTAGAAYSFLNPQKGWAYMPAVNVPAEIRETNPMAAWYLGDFTDPNSGVRFRMMKGTKNGDMSAYEAQLDIDSYGRVAMHQATVEQMRGRYAISKPDTYLNRQSNEDLVTELVSVFNEVSATGKHEYEFLRLAFPEYSALIPTTTVSYSNVPRSQQPGLAQSAAPAPVQQYVQPMPPPMAQPAFPQPAYPAYAPVSAGVSSDGHMPQASPGVLMAPVPPRSPLYGPLVGAVPTAQDPPMPSSPTSPSAPTTVPGISKEAADVNFARYKKAMDASKTK